MKRGFTLIEFMIVLAVIGMFVASLAPLFSNNRSRHSYGTMGVVEQRCISGYVHSISSSGNVQQVLNQNGGGIPCQ